MHGNVQTVNVTEQLLLLENNICRKILDVVSRVKLAAIGIGTTLSYECSVTEYMQMNYCISGAWKVSFAFVHFNTRSHIHCEVLLATHRTFLMLSENVTLFCSTPPPQSTVYN